MTETAVKINAELSWVYAAISFNPELLFDIALFGRHSTDTATIFLRQLCEKNDLSDAEFLVDQFGYRTILSQLGLNIGSTTLTETISKNGSHSRIRDDRFHNS